MTQPQPTAIDCIFENILGFMLPFLLASAGGDANLARAAIQELAEAHNVATATELEVVGRLLGFSVVAMDNLRLSMNRDLSDTKVLRYRSNAVALSRAGEQCRKILEVMQDNRKPDVKAVSLPAPVVADAPPPPALLPRPRRGDENKQPSRVEASQPLTGGSAKFPESTEAAKRDARLLLAMFARNGAVSGQTATIFPHIPDPAAAVDKAVREAFRGSRRAAAA